MLPTASVSHLIEVQCWLQLWLERKNRIRPIVAASAWMMRRALDPGGWHSAQWWTVGNRCVESPTFLRRYKSSRLNPQKRSYFLPPQNSEFLFHPFRSIRLLATITCINKIWCGSCRRQAGCPHRQRSLPRHFRCNTDLRKKQFTNLRFVTQTLCSLIAQTQI